MFTANCYIPTNILFGPGVLNELVHIKLPGKKALICMTSGKRLQETGVPQRVFRLLEQNHAEAVIFSKVTPNPTKAIVEKGAEIAKAYGCDYVIGLGGGSSIDTAKAIAILMETDRDLWDFAYTGSGKKLPIQKAAPVVAISTTAGTGTETDPYCVITKSETGEKLDFASDVLYPRVSVIDPETMLSLPRDLTLYQGFDAMFHAVECYLNNRHQNRLVDVFAREAIRTVSTWLPVAASDGNDLNARVRMAYAADICSGHTQAMINTTSHHIIAQTMGGLFPDLAHGASLIMIAEAYYTRIARFFPDLFDEIGKMMGQTVNPHYPGMGYLKGLVRLMEQTGVRELSMKRSGISMDDLPRIADCAVNRTGIADVDLHYTLSETDVRRILERSYR